MPYILFSAGFLLFIFGLRLIIKFLSLKTIFYSESVGNQTYNFEIQSSENMFGVYFVGGKSVKGIFKVQITDSKNVAMPASNNFLMLRTLIKNKPAVEVFSFSAQNGKYSLTLENTEQLEIRKSMLKSRQLFEKPLNIGYINLAVKETMPTSTVLLMIILPLVGLFIIAQTLIIFSL